MAWNEPGGGNNRDPWGGGGGNQGPPDLDEIIRRIKARLNGLFGGSGGSNGGSGGNGGIGNTGILVIAGIVVVGWLLSGIYIVDEGERGAVRRFGAHVATTEPGPHWRWPYPIGEVERVNVSRRRSIDIGSGDSPATTTRTSQDESVMLTADENLVSVNMEVQYRVADPEDYIYNFADPDKALRDISVSALREVVGQRQLSELLAQDDLDATFDRLGKEEELSEEEVKDLREQSSVVEKKVEEEKQQEEPSQDLVGAIRELVRDHVSQYEVGLQIVEVNVGRARPPAAVQDAFDDAVRAREDLRRLIQEAIAYKNEQVPKARGKAAQLTADAKSYASEKTNQAQGVTERFLALNREYQQAPRVTRERLYIQTMESVLGDTDKILVDTEGNTPLMHMPINGVLNRNTPARADNDANASGSSATSSGGSAGSPQPNRSNRTSSSDRQRESY
jgi:membrane protease subunit HflK